MATILFSLSDDDVERIVNRVGERIKKLLEEDRARATRPAMTPIDDRLQLSRVETAKRLGCSGPTIDRLVKRGLLRPNRAIRRIMFPMKEIHRFLAECSQVIEW